MALLEDAEPSLKLQLLICLKNYVNKKWAAKSRRMVRTSSAIPDTTKNTIRGGLLNLL